MGAYEELQETLELIYGKEPRKKPCPDCGLTDGHVEFCRERELSPSELGDWNNPA